MHHIQAAIPRRDAPFFFYSGQILMLDLFNLIWQILKPTVIISLLLFIPPSVPRSHLMFSTCACAITNNESAAS